MLLDHKIIESSWVLYEAEDCTLPMVKGYRINESLLNEDFSKILYETGDNTAENADNNFNGTNKLKISIYPDITIKKGEALHWISENTPSIMAKYLDFDYATSLPSTSLFRVKILNDKDQYHPYYMSLGKAQKIATKSNKKLFYFKNKFIIADSVQFEKLTLERFTYHYKWQVLSYLSDKLTFYRNPKTLRVYNHLTSLPSALLPFVRINNDYICQADLKCSQFTLLGNLFNYYVSHSGKELIALFKKKQTITFVSRMVSIMDKYNTSFPDNGYYSGSHEDIYNSNDVYTFIEDTLKYDFYNMLKTNLSLPQRKYAKNVAFETLFSSGKRESYYSAQLKQLYPTVININNEFKEAYGYENFSVGLQNIESEIFIDHIWKKVTDRGINSFTRHDSLLFPIRNSVEVESIINDVFASFDFIYKIDYEEFNKNEIWQRLFDETNYLDSLPEEVDEGMLYAIYNKIVNNNSVENNSVDIELVSNKSDNLEEDDMDEMTEQEIEESIFDQIQQFIDDPDIEFKLPNTIKDDYFEYVNKETIGCLASMDFVEQDIIDALNYDHYHMNRAVSTQQFQEKTNEFITYLIELKEDYLYLNDKADEKSDEPVDESEF